MKGYGEGKGFHDQSTKGIGKNQHSWQGTGVYNDVGAKGKAKRKGTFAGQCYLCGEWCHSQSRCKYKDEYTETLRKKGGSKGARSAWSVEVHEDDSSNKQGFARPRLPTEKEFETHNATHVPHRAWCPSCVAGRARDRAHFAAVPHDVKDIPQMFFDYCFLKTEGEEETIAIQVARDRRSCMLFAHMVPRKGLVHLHAATEMVKDIEKLGYDEIILKSDNEPVLLSVQAEVKKLREYITILENSPVSDSRANGAAERAVQAVGEQVYVLRHALELRVGRRLPGHHPVTAWLIEHAADMLSKFLVGDDERTAYERAKGKRYDKPAVEFESWCTTCLTHENKLVPKWGEGIFLGMLWRTGVFIIGTPSGILKSGSFRRVGAHRRWDAEAVQAIRGWRGILRRLCLDTMIASEC